MKKMFKLSAVVSLLLVLIIFVETPIEALSVIVPAIAIDEGVDPFTNETDDLEITDTIISEIESERTENTKTFLLKNGSNMLVEYDMPIHYQDTDGKWIDYDNSMGSTQKEIEIDDETTTREATVEESIYEEFNDNQNDDGMNDKGEEIAEVLVSNTGTETSEVEQELSSENEETNEQENEGVETITESDQEISTNNIKKIDVYSNRISDKDISFAKQSDEQDMVLYSDNEYTVSWGYQGINNILAKYSQDNTKYEGNDSFLVLKNLESIIKYESAYKDVDIECITYPLGIKENIILKNKSSENRFVCQYRISGLIAKKDEAGYIVLADSNGENKYYLTADYMIDAKGQLSNDISLQILSQENGILEVEMVADSEWLQADDREYPVKIDPTFLVGQDYQQVQCALIDSQYPDRCYAPGTYYGTPYVNVGGYGSELYRTLMRINSLPSLNNGDMIVNANVNLILCHNNFFTDSYIGLYEIADGNNNSPNNWSQMSVTWNTQPSTVNTLIDYQKVYSGMTDEYLTWNITDLVKKWYDGGNNNGFCLKTITSASDQQNVAFFSSNYPDITHIRPTFALTYRNNKGIEDYWSYSSINVGTAGTLSVNKYSGALTFSTSIASTADPIMPASVGIVYNSYMAGNYSLGLRTKVAKGWKLNHQQTVFFSSYYNPNGNENMDHFPYVLSDADGTEHYFYQKGDDTSKYYDEDGLGLELTFNQSDNDEQFIITDKDKNKMTFDSWGHLYKIYDANENAIQVNYNSRRNNAGYRISNIADSTGNTVSFSLNNNEFVSTVTDSAGRCTAFSYNNELLTAISRPDNTTVQFGYDSNGLLTSITDVDGYKVEITYDNTSRKKVSQIIEKDSDNAVGNIITFEYPKVNETIIHSSGVDGIYGNDDDDITTYQFDNFGREVSSQTHTAGGEDLGASHYDYTAGEVDSTGSNVKKINRLTNTHSVGKNVPNYIYNNNFENSEQWSNASWFYDATFTGSYSTDERMYGQRSYKISVSSYENTGAGRAYQDISGLTAGKTYTLSGYVKVTSFSGTETTSGAFIGATFGSTKYFSENVKPVTDENVNNGWRRVSVTFTVPNGYTSARIHIALRSATGTAYFDALQLTEGETPVSFNLVDNESFERNAGFSAVGWNSGNLTLGYGMDGENSDGIAHDGQKCFRIAGDPTILKELWQRVSVSGSESDCYILSGWGKGNSVNLSSDRKFEISATVSYTNGTSRSLGAVQFNPAVTSWQFVSKALSLSDQNANTELTPQYIYIQLRYHYQGNAAYFDNISLVKEPSSSYTYDNDGNLVFVSANAQKNSTMEYNSDNQLTKIIDPKGGTYEYTYVDGSKNIVKTAKTQQGAVYTYDYDSRGSVTQLEGEVTVDNQTLKNKSQQSITYPTSSSSSYTVTTSDSRGINSSSEYNAKTGTLSNTTDNNNVTTSYTYQTGNNLLSSVSKNGSTVSYTYSADKKRLSSISSPTAGYSFSYNSFGERTAINVGNQALAAYTYNAGGTLTRMTYGNGDYVDYSYDNYGNVRERSQNGTVTYRAYADNTGAVTREVDESNNVEYNYLYDSTDRLVSKKASYISAASGARSFKSSFSYDYDLNNNVTKFSVLTAKGPITTDYTYGLDNLPLTATFQSGKVLTNTFDKLGRLTKTNLNTNSNIETTYTYLASGYEGDYTTNFVETETNGVFTYKYEYDANGNITKVYRKNGNTYVVSEEYTYNELNELTQVDYLNLNKRYTYSYDSGGNISKEKVYTLNNGTPTYQSSKNYVYGDFNWHDKLTSYGGSAITYDAIGNPLSYRGMTLTWQNGRQLASSSDGSTVTNYTYGADGMRMTKKVGSSTIYYQYFNGLLIQEIKGAKILDYSYDTSGQVYAVRYRTNANDTGNYYYYAHNTRGDIVGIYNADGSLHAKYSYDVWGNPLSVTDASNAAITSQTDIANLQSFRYRGYYYDSNSGFYYLQSRYYDPVTHRFINADNISDTQAGVLGYNLFVYAANNPVNNSDTTGKGIFKSIFKFVAKVAATVVKSYCKRAKKVNEVKNWGTVSSGIGGNVGVGNICGGAQIGVSSDTQGNFGLQYSISCGVSVSTGGLFSASGTTYQSFSNARDLYDLTKYNTYQLGVSAGVMAYCVPAYAGTDVFQVHKSAHENFYGITNQSGFGTPGFEAHAEYNSTRNIIVFNVFDIVIDVCDKILE